jgi:hypothetical protein
MNISKKRRYLLFAPTPLIGSSIKLLHHVIVNLGLLCWVLSNKAI